MIAVLAWTGTASLLLLAVVQGATEFLPVSSSGHLALFESWLAVGQQSLLEDVMLHLGTLAAVVIFYRRDLATMIVNFFGRGATGDAARRDVAMLALGTIPAVVIGLTFKDTIERAFDAIGVVLACLAATGLVLWRTKAVVPTDREIGVKVALLIGCAQAVAILPGCSRSGWTIATALLLGVAPAKAARFSFLLSIPAILGATVLELSDLPAEPVSWGPILAAVVLAGMVGFLCLGWLVRLVRGMQLYRFSFYLWSVAVGGGILLAFTRI